MALMRINVGDGIGLDAGSNGTFDYVEAIQLARRRAELGYLWLEEPLDPSDLAALIKLNDQGILPLAAGEGEFGPCGAIGLVVAGALRALQPGFGSSCGLTRFSRAATAAPAPGRPLRPHPHAGPPEA